MPKKSWTLIDTANDTYDFEVNVEPADVGGKAKGYDVDANILQGGLRDNVETVDINNGTCKFTVVPTRGMGVWKAAVGKLDVGWNSPVKGPVHPNFVRISEPSGLGWLDGFDELLARCGLYSNGAPDFDDKGILTYPLHGRIANLPCHELVLTVDGDSGEITLVGVVDDCRFHFQKLRLTSTIKTKSGESGFRITDEITNLSGAPGEAQLLYHINFGPPLLDPGAKLVAPVKTVVPRNATAAAGLPHWESYGNEQAGAPEQVFFMELLADSAGQTQVLLKNAHSTQGVSLKFSKKQLPWFTQWKNTPTAQDGYVTGLEPGTNFPNPRSYEGKQNRVVKLKPGETIRFDLAVEILPDAAGVQKAEAAVAKLQGDTQPKVFDMPQEGWCAP